MNTYTFSASTFNAPLLSEELRAAISAFQPVERNGRLESTFSLVINQARNEVIIRTPDAVTESEVQTVIDAHDASQVSASKAIENRRTVLRGKGADRTLAEANELLDL
jgi:t-SNARE complex subunit (syntaxin)